MAKAQEVADEIKAQEPNDNQGELVIRQLDLNSLNKVRECAQEILDTESKIHILINNAGIFGSSERLTDDGFEMHFGVNHLGHFLFTLLLLPRIIESGPARIITIASSLHRCKFNIKIIQTT